MVDATTPARQTVVLHLIGSLNRGGAESVALDLCRAIPRSKVRQVFVTLGGNEGSLAPRFRTAGAEVIAVDATPWQLPLAVWRVVRRHRPDVVQSHVALASGVLLLVAWVAGCRNRIARVHSQGDGRHGVVRVPYRAAMRWLLAVFASRVVAVTPAAREFASRGLGPFGRHDKFIVIPNGVDTTRFHADRGPRHVPPVVLHVGRADPAKNRRVIPAIAEATKRIEQVDFVVVGAGGVADLGPGADTWVECVGPREDVHELMAQASALILPSVREGLPGVVLEALATGVPVVASDLAGLRWLASELPGIQLVGLRSSPGEWAAALLDAIRMPIDQREEIVVGVRASGFTLEANADEWVRLWRR